MSGSHLDARRVGELASTPVTAAAADVDALSALHRMYRRGVRQLAVLDEGEVTGVVSAAELVRGVAERHAQPDVTAGDLCSAPVLRVDADELVETAAQRALATRAAAVLVVRGEEICGLISTDDLLHGLAEEPDRR